MQTGQEYFASCLQAKALTKTKTFADMLEKERKDQGVARGDGVREESSMRQFDPGTQQRASQADDQLHLKTLVALSPATHKDLSCCLHP